MLQLEATSRRHQKQLTSSSVVAGVVKGRVPSSLVPRIKPPAVRAGRVRQRRAAGRTPLHSSLHQGSATADGRSAVSKPPGYVDPVRRGFFEQRYQIFRRVSFSEKSRHAVHKRGFAAGRDYRGRWRSVGGGPRRRRFAVMFLLGRVGSKKSVIQVGAFRKSAEQFVQATFFDRGAVCSSYYFRSTVERRREGRRARRRDKEFDGLGPYCRVCILRKYFFMCRSLRHNC